MPRSRSGAVRSPARVPTRGIRAHLLVLLSDRWEYNVTVAVLVIFHNPERCRSVRQYLEAWGHHIVLHFLPTYSPDTNPTERVW